MQRHIQPKSRGWIQSLFIILCMESLLPLTLLIIFFTLVKSIFSASLHKTYHSGKTILLTGGKMTKSLQLARLFARSGHRVILAETEKYRASGHAYSNCVSKFYVNMLCDILFSNDSILQFVFKFILLKFVSFSLK